MPRWGTVEERFWNKVDRRDLGECWLWIGAQDGRGYGQMHQGPQALKAHRLSWKIHFGIIPDKLLVCHRCDVPLCVNPAHLFLGDQKANMMDAKNKGRTRGPRGERHGKSKLAAEQVVLIRKKYATGGVTQAELAKQYGVTRSNIECITRGKTWTHVGGPITHRWVWRKHDA